MKRCCTYTALFALALACGCAASPSPSPPRPTPENVPTIQVSPVEGGVAAQPEPQTELDAAAPPSMASDPCRGSAFELDVLPDDCRASRAATRHTLTGLAASMSVDGTSVRSGEDVGVTLTLTNTTTEDLELVLKPGCASLELQAFQGKKRADFVNPHCGFGTGCGGAHYRLVLTPGGTLTKRLRYKARLVRFTPACKSVEAPLPTGRYELHVDSSPFFGLQDALTNVTAPLVVTR